MEVLPRVGYAKPDANHPAGLGVQVIVATAAREPPDFETMTTTFKNFIGGEWVEPAGGEYFENRNPADHARCDRPVSHVPTRGDVQHAVDVGAGAASSSGSARRRRRAATCCGAPATSWSRARTRSPT